MTVTGWLKSKTRIIKEKSLVEWFVLQTVRCQKEQEMIYPQACATNSAHGDKTLFLHLCEMVSVDLTNNVFYYLTRVRWSEKSKQINSAGIWYGVEKITTLAQTKKNGTSNSSQTTYPTYNIGLFSLFQPYTLYN
jgi:hypothetical protein